MGYGQMEGFYVLQPLLRALTLALVTMAVSTGVIAVMVLVAVLAIVHLSAEGFCTASGDILDNFQVNAWDFIVIFPDVFGPILLKDSGQRGHARAPIRSLIFSETPCLMRGVSCV